MLYKMRKGESCRRRVKSASMGQSRKLHLRLDIATKPIRRRLRFRYDMPLKTE